MRLASRLHPLISIVRNHLKYEALVREAVASLDGAFNLGRLLSRIDALDKSVPTLTELNDAFAALKRSGDVGFHDWSPITVEAYWEAVAQNQEAVARFLESQGISRKQQEHSLKWHASQCLKRDA